MIKKLLLVRKAASKSTLLEEAGMSAFSKGKPLNISPLAWKDEAGLSHYGFLLQELKLKDLEHLNEFVASHEGCTVVDFEDGDTQAKALARVGLKINEAA